MSVVTMMQKLHHRPILSLGEGEAGELGDLNWSSQRLVVLR
jgi:hypothetical protein